MATKRSASKKKTGGSRKRASSANSAEPFNERKPRHSITDFIGTDADTHTEWIKVAQAIRDIVTSPVTPSRLYNDVMSFLNDHSSELWNDLMKSPEIIVKILVTAGIKDDEGSASDAG